METLQPAQYILYCDQSQTEYTVACCVHNGPPSPKFQILPSQLRQTADRAAGLCIKSLGLRPCDFLMLWSWYYVTLRHWDPFTRLPVTWYCDSLRPCDCCVCFNLMNTLSCYPKSLCHSEPCELLTLWHCDLMSLWACDIATLKTCDLVTQVTMLPTWPCSSTALCDLVRLRPCEVIGTRNTKVNRRRVQ